MASRGAYVAGTDGSDFKHRETVANHYKVSAENKGRMRFAIVLHWMLTVLMVIRLIPGFMLALGIRPLPALIRHLNLPQIRLWELVWLLSAVSGVLGYLSVPKNNIQLLTQSVFGIVIFGVCPLLVGAYDLWDELTQYMSYKQGSMGKDQPAASHAAAAMGLGIPAVVFFYLFIFVALQIHMLTIYCAQRLREAWRLASAPVTRGGRPVSYADKHK